MNAVLRVAEEVTRSTVGLNAMAPCLARRHWRVVVRPNRTAQHAEGSLRGSGLGRVVFGESQGDLGAGIGAGADGQAVGVAKP